MSSFLWFVDYYSILHNWGIWKIKFCLLKLKEFAVRNDMGCGSTIGPILASGVGIRTVDCGIAQLSMHRYKMIFALILCLERN